MFRRLDDLVLLKEVARLEKYKNNDKLRSELYRKRIVIKNTSFLKKEAIPEEVKSTQFTDLTDYVQLGVLADETNIKKDVFLHRIKAMRETGHKLFDFEFLENGYFIKVDKEFSDLLERHTPFLLDLNISNWGMAKQVKLIGDIKVGFY